MGALRAFILSFGMSLADIEVPAETLYAENRKRIDATTVRRAFVPDPVRVEVAGYPPGLATVELPNHPDRPELGKRVVPAGPVFFLPYHDLASRPGAEVRLKDLLNVRLPAEIPAAGEGLTATFTSGRISAFRGSSGWGSKGRSPSTSWTWREITRSGSESGSSPMRDLATSSSSSGWGSFGSTATGLPVRARCARSTDTPEVRAKV